MKYLLTAVLLAAVVPSVYAGSDATPPGLHQGGAITIYKTEPGLTNYWDTHGNNVQTYTDRNGLTTYTGKEGTGTMYEPNASRELSVPPTSAPYRDPRAGCTKWTGNVAGCQ